MTRTRDMTRGNPFGLLFGFAFSLMIGNVFQQLYTFVDTMIVGKYLGVTALAALGATEWLVFVMFGCVQGITQGFSISMAKRFGSHDEEELKKDMGASVLLCLVLGVLFTIAGMALCKPVLQLLHTPQDMIGMAQVYLRTLYSGVCISFGYNILARFCGLWATAGRRLLPFLWRLSAILFWIFYLWSYCIWVCLERRSPRCCRSCYRRCIACG